MSESGDGDVSAAAGRKDAGCGLFTFPDGATYEGDWSILDGVKVRHGHGCFTDGVETYEGGWKADKQDGKGTFRFASGAVYTGDWAAGRFEGAGRYDWADGSYYEGQWKDSRMHGDGVYVDAERVEWRGRFHNGKFFNGHSYLTLR